MVKKIDYKSAVLAYLQAHQCEEISRSQLIKNTGISKSRLTEVLQSIKADGYEITTPPRSGLVCLENNNSLDVLPSIKDSDIRQWTIMLLLSKFGNLTFDELLIKVLLLIDSAYEQNTLLIDTDTRKKAYDDNHLIKAIRKNSLNDDVSVAKNVISVTALRKDLTYLREQKLVNKVQGTHTTYSLSTAAPYIIPLSNESLYELCVRYEESASSTTDVSPLKSAMKKIQKLVDYEGNDIKLARYGKINEVSQESLDSFSTFMSHPYRTNLLLLESNYKDFHNEEIFAVGLLFYSVETNSFYALGKNITKDEIQSRRIDWIDNITPLKEPNREFHKSAYFDIYEEMFSSQYQKEIYQVKVLFDSFGNVPKRFYDLHNTRKNSIIRPIFNPPEDCHYSYIYEDTLRGLSDFQRFLRTFGVSVLVMEPQILREKMIYTYTTVIERSESYNE